MFVNKLASVSVISQVVCDGCSASCGDRESAGFVDFEFATLSANWGYSSRRDGESCLLHLCENCFDIVVQALDRRKTALLANRAGSAG